MPFDPTVMPTTLDAVHLGLVALVLILLILLIILVTIGVIALLRRKQPVTVIVERVPPELTAMPAAGAPLRVAIERVPAGMIPAAPPAPAAVREIPQPVAQVRPERPEPVIVKEATPDAALQLLGLLQKEARFLDFVQENIANYSDSEIGAAARIVHEGFRRVLNQHFELQPIRTEQENSRVTLPKGFDASAVRPIGNIVGEPPFTGTLIHRGWRATRVKLPKIAEGHDTRIIAPAEVEL